LNIGGPDRAALVRAQHTVADALRTATIPGEDGRRLLFIRRLDLGRVTDGIAPATLALHIQRVIASLAGDAVRWDAPDAPRAEAVFSRDPIAPLVALALTIARGRRADAWFWRAALPGFAPELPPVDVVRRLIRLALETPA